MAHTSLEWQLVSAQTSKAQAKRAEEKLKFDSELHTLRSQLLVLQGQYAALESDHEDLARNTTDTISVQKAELAAHMRQSALLEGELTEARRVADECSDAISELEAWLDDIAAAQDTSMHAP